MEVVCRGIFGLTGRRILCKTALRYFGETRFDFVDCLMIGYATIEGRQVFTLDKKLKKHIERITAV